jgi:hypothetical protein
MTMEEGQSRRRGRWRWWVLLAAVALPVIAVVAVPRIWSVTGGFASQPALTSGQMAKVGGAIAQYTEKNTRRPERVEDLVQAGLLAQADLYDSRRKEAVQPKLDPNSGHYDPIPDVLYFPALRPGDPGDLVMLCTLVTQKPGEKLQVVYNDGRAGELAPQEMVQALQRTYTYIGGQLQPASQPAEKKK